MPEDDNTDLVTSHETELAVQQSRPDFKRLSHEDLGEILRLSAKGWSQRKIAEFIGCSQPSVGYALQRMAGSAEHVQAAARANTHKALGAWDRAMEKAADRGDHRPARELIELAHTELRPQASNSGGGGGVTVIVNQPGQLIERPPDIVVSPVEIVVSSETPIKD